MCYKNDLFVFNNFYISAPGPKCWQTYSKKEKTIYSFGWYICMYIYQSCLKADKPHLWMITYYTYHHTAYKQMCCQMLWAENGKETGSIHFWPQGCNKTLQLTAFPSHLIISSHLIWSQRVLWLTNRANAGATRNVFSFFLPIFFVLYLFA